MAGRFTKFCVCTLLFLLCRLLSATCNVQNFVQLVIYGNWIQTKKWTRRNKQTKKKVLLLHSHSLIFLRPSNICLNFLCLLTTGQIRRLDIFSQSHFCPAYTRISPCSTVHINTTSLCRLQIVFYVYQLGPPYFTNNYHVVHIETNKLGGIFDTYGENRNV